MTSLKSDFGIASHFDSSHAINLNFSPTLDSDLSSVLHFELSWFRFRSRQPYYAKAEIDFDFEIDLRVQLVGTDLMMEPEGRQRNSIMEQHILAVFGLVEIVLKCTLLVIVFLGLMIQPKADAIGGRIRVAGASDDAATAYSRDELRSQSKRHIQLRARSAGLRSHRGIE
ncbi:hypothetical protein EVAR_11788_1 [Eumeta japonica]|uniref:Uncharacterized protein n=1 Tax=Eumeta variegata TaxID=151549 RepID=A0A4C1UQS1_EUMVA|nr:hypothetical protein EVAR_11788_1 [Eumeta japonica]